MKKESVIKKEAQQKTMRGVKIGVAGAMGVGAAAAATATTLSGDPEIPEAEVPEAEASETNASAPSAGHHASTAAASSASAQQSQPAQQPVNEANIAGEQAVTEDDVIIIETPDAVEAIDVEATSELPAEFAYADEISLDDYIQDMPATEYEDIHINDDEEDIYGITLEEIEPDGMPNPFCGSIDDILEQEEFEDPLLNIEDHGDFGFDPFA